MRRARALFRRSISPRRPLQASGLAIAAFVLAAVVVAARNALAPFERGWWLAAYALLVGGVSQLLLVAGQRAPARRSQRHEPGRGLLWAQLALWNIGAAAVAVADLAEAPPVLAAGSLLLLVALSLFLAELRHPCEATDATTGALTRAYLMLALVLVASVIVGTALGGALPGF